MHRRRLLSLLLALPTLLSTGIATPALAAPPIQRSKIVFHVNSDDPDQQDVVLRNLHNHIASVGAQNLDIKVLLQGEGVALLLLPEALPHTRRLHHANATPAVRKRVDALRAQGVAFEVSALSLKEHGIDAKHDLYKVKPGDLVPNALAYLTELQNRGYTYIKP
jgi:intracellular sulfur oxidation DsrE/DsrF family protein